MVSNLEPCCKTRENSMFLRKGKMIISVRKYEIFLDLEKQNGLYHWNHLAKSSYHVEFSKIPRQSKFHIF